MGRVMPLVVPPIELATIMYVGAHTDIDLAYGALATYVAQHALAVEGPVREYYVVGPHDTADETAWPCRRHFRRLTLAQYHPTMGGIYKNKS